MVAISIFQTQKATRTKRTKQHLDNVRHEQQRNHQAEAYEAYKHRWLIVANQQLLSFDDN
jgi:hypothetical protein